MHPLEKFLYCPKCGSSHFIIQNEKSKCCKECGFEYFLNPSAATAAFIFNEKKELLVLRRKHNPGRGMLDLPGGFCDIKETAEEAIKREVKEETNLEVTSLRYAFSLPNQYEYSKFIVPTLDLFYVCTINNLSEVQANDDAEDFLWISLENLHPKEFALESIKKALSMLLEQPKRYIL